MKETVPSDAQDKEGNRHARDGLQHSLLHAHFDLHHEAISLECQRTEIDVGEEKRHFWRGSRVFLHDIKKFRLEFPPRRTGPPKFPHDQLMVGLHFLHGAECRGRLKREILQRHRWVCLPAALVDFRSPCRLLVGLPEQLKEADAVPERDGLSVSFPPLQDLTIAEFPRVLDKTGTEERGRYVVANHLAECSLPRLCQNEGQLCKGGHHSGRLAIVRPQKWTQQNDNQKPDLIHCTKTPHSLRCRLQTPQGRGQKDPRSLCCVGGRQDLPVECLNPFRVQNSLPAWEEERGVENQGRLENLRETVSHRVGSCDRAQSFLLPLLGLQQRQHLVGTYALNERQHRRGGLQTEREGTGTLPI
mmetsp:Transcript_5395/g.10676  ORF Transcript_5395/g.10676 Transcript_5395/m.10676 type:complete len:359 (+) Transcript_5395:1778-2854(+)